MRASDTSSMPGVSSIPSCSMVPEGECITQCRQCKRTRELIRIAAVTRIPLKKAKVSTDLLGLVAAGNCLN